MTLSLWRYAHLILAVLSSLFLLILSVTGVILAVDAVGEKIPAYRIDDFDKLSLAESIPALTRAYPEIVELTVDHNGFVAIDATDTDGDAIKAYIDPRNGAVLGALKPKNQFIQWNIALHRSLFLKETGRIIVGVVSFLLLLIAISGVVLIVKRQQGLRHFFAKINRDFFAQYFHVVSGRLALLPVMIIALTGTYLFLIRVGIIENHNREVAHPAVGTSPAVAMDEFPVFRQTRLADVEKIEFPFMPDDPDEHYVLKLKDRVLAVSQLTGEIVEETRYPYSAVLEKLSLDLHTGRTSALWAIILGFASLNIIVFIYTGFGITFRRTRTRIRNQYDAENAEIVTLVGTENGSTLFYANQIHRQLLADGKKSFLAEMNEFRSYPSAEHLLVFTSTYGLGTAPANATHFEQLLAENPQPKSTRFSVVGFGSKAYPDFCAYARYVDEVLEKQGWASRQLGLHTVNDRSAEEFTGWIQAWSGKSRIRLATTPALYQLKAAGLRKMKVVEKTAICEQNPTFRILLEPESGVSFQSGDLLAIYPAADGRERLYSIAKRPGGIQLVVRLHPNGLGSDYLYRLELNSTIRARVVRNAAFHFPQSASAVVMIANGAGIAPFLGMIENNRRKIPVHLYAGFRYESELTQYYRQFAAGEAEAKRLKSCQIALSKGEAPCYVTDLVRGDGQRIAGLLEANGVVMLCGSFAMQRDVEAELDRHLQSRNGRELSYYRARGQVLTDCY